MVGNSCKGCTNRKVGCHGSCESYKNWLEELKKEKNAYRKANDKYWNAFYHK